MDPRLLLLDEPLSALDRGLRERLAHDLRDILVAAGTTALLVTHDQEEAFTVADRMALMRAGRVVGSGTVDEVWRHPADAEAARFLGYATVLEGQAARQVLPAAGSADHVRCRSRCAGPRCAWTRRGRCAVGCCPRGRPRTPYGSPSTSRAWERCTRWPRRDDGATVLGVGNDIRLAVDLNRTARLAAQAL